MSAESTLQKAIIDIDNKRAASYDFTASLYYLIGYPEWKYRRIGFDFLGLTPGDTVVEIGCGAGLNFGLLEQAVGPEGCIIDVDLTEAMREHLIGVEYQECI
jgi:demethylmenaquinone methyltransferase/2-methoxy-6-polyprenyl-1,4-benzoquinol methylase